MKVSFKAFKNDALNKITSLNSEFAQANLPSSYQLVKGFGTVKNTMQIKGTSMYTYLPRESRLSVRGRWTGFTNSLMLTGLLS
jgi:hypothetical protein